MGHLHPSTSSSLKAEGAKSSERSERATREGVDLVVGKLAIIFRGLFALAARSGDRTGRVEGSDIILYLDTWLPLPRLDDTSVCSLNAERREINNIFGI